MSRVTNLILNIDILEDEETRIKEVNLFFDEQEQKGLVSVDENNSGWYGGSKNLECHLYIGAFNYLDLDKFIEHCNRKVNFKEEHNQIIVMEQDDDEFRIIKLGGK